MNRDAGREININKKPQKARERPDVWTYYTANQGIWTHGLRPYELRTITGRTFMIAQKQRGWPDIETDRHKSLTGPY